MLGGEVKTIQGGIRNAILVSLNSVHPTSHKMLKLPYLLNKKLEGSRTDPEILQIQINK